MDDRELRLSIMSGLYLENLVTNGQPSSFKKYYVSFLWEYRNSVLRKTDNALIKHATKVLVKVIVKEWDGDLDGLPPLIKYYIAQYNVDS